MADIVRYVDTGADAGGDGTTPATSSGDNTHAYQSLNAWDAEEETDLTGGGGDTHTVRCNRTNSGGIDTGRVQLLWTTSAADDLNIIADDFPAGGIYDGTKYVLHNDDATDDAIQSRTGFLHLVNLQVLVTEASTNNRYGISYINSPAGADSTINSCIFKGVCSGTGEGQGIKVNHANMTITIYNTPVYGFFASSDIGFKAINIDDCTAAYIYNCTIANNTIGISRGGGTVVSQNNTLFGNENDHSGTIDIDFCGTEEGAGEGDDGYTITQTADDYAALVVDAAGGDFHLTDASSEAYNTGNGAIPKSIFVVDIVGTTRGPADGDWDTGAFEFIVGAPVGAAGIMTTNSGFWGPTF